MCKLTVSYPLSLAANLRESWCTFSTGVGMKGEGEVHAQQKINCNMDVNLLFEMRHNNISGCAIRFMVISDTYTLYKWL